MITINKIKILLALFTSVCFGLIATSCENESKQESTRKGDDNNRKVQTVEVVKPQPRTFTAEVLITGTATPNQKVTIYAMESGYIKSIRKDIGDKVKKGEVIAVLDNPELFRQQEKLKAQLQARQTVYDRLKSTYEKTPALTPLQVVENAESEFLSAQADLNGVNDRINFLTIRAPFDGIVSQRFVDNGALLQGGLNQSNPQALVVLQEIDPIRLVIPLPESDALAIREGMEAEITFPELPGESFTAKVSRTSGALDPGSKTMRIELDIANPDRKITTGMYAKALMRIQSRENVSSLPLTTKVRHQDEPFVLVVKDEKVERVPLREGLSGTDYYEVLNPEITEESLVIIKGKGLVKPGQTVEPILKKQ